MLSPVVPPMDRTWPHQADVPPHVSIWPPSNYQSLARRDRSCPTPGYFSNFVSRNYPLVRKELLHYFIPVLQWIFVFHQFWIWIIFISPVLTDYWKRLIVMIFICDFQLGNKFSFGNLGSNMYIQILGRSVLTKPYFQMICKHI